MRNIAIAFTFFLVFIHFSSNGQNIEHYLDYIEENYFHDAENIVPFFESKFYKDLESNPDFYYLNTIVDYSKIDSSILFDQDTLGNGKLSEYINPLILLNDVENVDKIEKLYIEYVDQFCQRWDGIIGSDNETYDNYRLIRLTPLGSADRFVLYSLHNLLVSYKLHEFKDKPEAILRVFETGKVDHLNYPILDYQFKCLPKVYWGPATQLNSNVFLPYKDVMYDFLKETILSMEIPPDSKARLRDYKNYAYFVQNPEMFRGIIDKDIEEYALENIEYYVENQAGHMLNSIALQSHNDQFKTAYLEKFMDVYLPQVNPNSKFRFGDRNMIYELLNSNYELVSDEIINFEREIRKNKAYHKSFLLNILSGIPLSASFYHAFSMTTEDNEINEVLNQCIRNMGHTTEMYIEQGTYVRNLPESERYSKTEIRRIIRKYDREIEKSAE